MVEVKNLNLIQSGIEPVDKLLGGLERGYLYLAHGEAAGKSLFGIRFLIEGLRHGEPVALVVRAAPEDAVRRFAQLGYDCLDDVKQNRLVILEYGDDIGRQIAYWGELTPALRELEWRLRTAQPQRIVFDPILPLIANTEAELESRLYGFTRWALSFQATILMVAGSEYKESLSALKPYVRESFRFDIRDVGEAATRYFAFEKSPELSEQEIEIDPLRGVFLLHRAPAAPNLPATTDTQPSRMAEPQLESVSVGREERQPVQDIFSPVQINSNIATLSGQTASVVPFPVRVERGVTNKADSITAEPEATEAKFVTVDFDVSFSNTFTPADERDAGDDLLEFLNEIDEAINAIRVPDNRGGAPDSPPVLTVPENMQIPAQESVIRAAGTAGGGYGRRASDLQDRRGAPGQERRRLLPPPAGQKESAEISQINPATFNIIVIEEDASLCAQVAEALSPFSVTTVQDVFKGLANVMAANPDLIILDLDMPIVDGFKVLAQIRAGINAPIITLSQLRQRASDRIFSTELGSDYYLTKPLNLIELRQKARQLIGRYRGIPSWISDLPVLNRALAESGYQRAAQRLKVTRNVSDARRHRLLSYEQFVEQVEARIKVALERGTSFSVVGLDPEKMKRASGEKLTEILDLMSEVVRSEDVLARNPRNELVVLLCGTDTTGAQAFIHRLKRSITQYAGEDLPVWIRSYPDYEEFNRTAEA